MGGGEVGEELVFAVFAAHTVALNFDEEPGFAGIGGLRRRWT